MKILNTRERKQAITRFSILYLVALAIPVFIVLSSLSVRNVGSKDSKEMIMRLQKRDQALSKVHQLAAKLNNMQRFRNNDNYDEQRIQFEKELDVLQTEYLADTITYGETYNMLSILRLFHKQFEESGKSLDKTVNDYQTQLSNARDSINSQDDGVNEKLLDLQAQLRDLRSQLRDSEADLKEAKRQNTSSDKSSSQCAAQLDKLSEKCKSSLDMVDNVNKSVNEIEAKTNEITSKLFSNENKKIRTSILTEINNIKTNTAKIKRTLTP